MVLTGALASCALRLSYLTRSFKNLFHNRVNMEKKYNKDSKNCSKVNDNILIIIIVKRLNCTFFRISRLLFKNRLLYWISSIMQLKNDFAELTEWKWYRY